MGLRRLGLALLLAVPMGAQEDGLVLRMNRFAHAYNAFVLELNRGKLDVRDARELTRKWKEIESSGEWPK